MLYIQFLCSCTHWQSEFLSSSRSLFESPHRKEVLADAHVFWHVADWLVGWLRDGPCSLLKSMTWPTPQFAQPLSMFFFFLVAKVTPGLDERRPTSCLLSCERRDWWQDGKQSSPSLLWCRYSKRVYHSGMRRCLFPVQPCNVFLLSRFQFY